MPTATQTGTAGGSGGMVTADRNTPKFKLKVGKTPKAIDAKVAARVVEIVVDQAIDMADMCKVILRNDDFAISDSEDWKPGSKLELELGYEENGAKTWKVFEGEINALYGDFPRRGPMNVRVIAYTGYHKLMRGRHMRAWEHTKLSDIAKAIAGECKLKGVVDATSDQFEYLFQRNQTNLEFLLELAERVGYEVFAGDGKLFFRKPTPEKAKVRTLKKGERLLAFNPRVHSALRPTSVRVMSYDADNVTGVCAEAKDPQAEGGPKMNGKVFVTDIAKKLGEAEQVVTEVVFRTEKQAKQFAVARFRESNLNLVRATADCQGAAELRPGFVVDVQGCGAIFSGPYYLTRVVHDFLPDGFSTRLGMKKTSIEVPPPPPPDDLAESPLDDEDIPEFEGSEAPLDEDWKGGPDLDNLKLAVGDEPPDWFFKGQELDNDSLLKILKYGYNPKLGPEIKLECEQKKIDVGARTSVVVTFARCEKAKITAEPAGCVQIDKTELAKSGAVVVKGLSDGKVAIRAGGILGNFEAASGFVEIEVVGPKVQLDGYGYIAPKLELETLDEKREYDVGATAKISVTFAGLDEVRLRLDKPDGAWLEFASLNKPKQVGFVGKKDGPVTVFADGVLRGKKVIAVKLELNVIGPNLEMKDVGYKGPRLAVTADRNEINAGEKAKLQVDFAVIEQVNFTAEPAANVFLSHKSLGQPGVVEVEGLRDGLVTIHWQGIMGGRPKLVGKVDIQVNGHKLGLDDFGYGPKGGAAGSAQAGA